MVVVIWMPLTLSSFIAQSNSNIAASMSLSARQAVAATKRSGY